MADDQRAQELAAITPAEVTGFVDRLAYWRGADMMPNWTTTHEYDRSEARALGLAKRHLETVLAWRPDAVGADTTERLIKLIERALKSAVVLGDRVKFAFTGAELLDLRSAVPLLERYDLTKKSDARNAGRRQYPKRNH